MFWFRRQKFVGSHTLFRRASRSYLASPYAALTRSSPALRKLMYAPPVVNGSTAV
jgi:hypothetical protein